MQSCDKKVLASLLRFPYIYFRTGRDIQNFLDYLLSVYGKYPYLELPLHRIARTSH